MQRRSFLRNTGLTLAGLALLSKQSLAAFLSDPTWTIKMLTDDIGVFSEKGGTILFMITKKGIVVVDADGHSIGEHAAGQTRAAYGRLQDLLDRIFRQRVNGSFGRHQHRFAVMQLPTPRPAFGPSQKLVSVEQTMSGIRHTK